MGDSMTHKATNNDIDINATSQTDSEPKIPLKLGLWRMTHVVERGHDATTALLKSKHTLTPAPYRNW